MSNPKGFTILFLSFNNQSIHAGNRLNAISKKASGVMFLFTTTSFEKESK
ncbi:hypothetical protein BACSTE_00441 [Bacteroides stercoris ATCC 43183]|uniref:Uncharacterized protein n=1 Tax=Bacteroides stercoris ATCC 43183 TaxID=449673 RepID=B0NLY2_BACSE|nr:hypothetical protein BACSTE_00441 [Bacteroides stercoris ATCC 43183]